VRASRLRLCTTMHAMATAAMTRRVATTAPVTAPASSESDTGPGAAWPPMRGTSGVLALPVRESTGSVLPEDAVAREFTAAPELAVVLERAVACVGAALAKWTIEFSSGAAAGTWLGAIVAVATSGVPTSSFTFVMDVLSTTVLALAVVLALMRMVLAVVEVTVGVVVDVAAVVVVVAVVGVVVVVEVEVAVLELTVVVSVVVMVVMVVVLVLVVVAALMAVQPEMAPESSAMYTSYMALVSPRLAITAM